MNRNIEFKARLADRGGVEARAAALADHGPELLVQTDTFFLVPRGRLKLREFPEGPADLIYYERADEAEVRESRYWRVPVEEGEAMRELLGAAHGVRAVVRKRRTLYLVGQTRLHLDDVEGLGDFLELETVLRPDQSLEEGQALARGCMVELGVGEADLCSLAYVDLLEAAAHSGPSRPSQ